MTEFPSLLRLNHVIGFPSLLRLNHIPLCIHILCVQTTFCLSFDRHLGYFHLLATVNNFAMNVGV